MADFAIIRWQLAQDKLTSSAAKRERCLVLKRCLTDVPQSAVCCWMGTERSEPECKSRTAEPQCKRRRATPAHMISAAHLAAAQRTPAHIHIIAALRAAEEKVLAANRAKIPKHRLHDPLARNLIEEFDQVAIDLYAEAGC